MRAYVLASAVAFAALVSACGLKAEESGDGAAKGATADDATEISINLGDEDGQVAVKSDKESGRVRLKTPMFDFDVKMPDIDIDADDVDIDGVNMFPGTKLKTFDIDAGNSAAADRAVVRVGMAFPAAAGTVADWYEDELKQRDVTYSRTGDSFTGKTADGDRFTLAVAAAGSTSTGDLVIREAK